MWDSLQFGSVHWIEISRFWRRRGLTPGLKDRCQAPEEWERQQYQLMWEGQGLGRAEVDSLMGKGLMGQSVWR